MIPLDAPGIEPTAQVIGGKARPLASLVRAGVPVPRARVVPASAFRRALEDGGLLELAEQVHRGQLDQAAALRAGIEALELPPAQRRRWTEQAATLGARLAVRSSGLAEDGAEHSFAGQHRTELGVEPKDVPAAILRCWASLYAERALAYRRAGPPPGALAVLVQELVDPRTAGVVFTINPVSGSWREMVVEAVWGLGELLVSGQVTPHFYLVRRPRRAPRGVQRLYARVRLRVMEEDLPELNEQLVAGPDGTRRVPLPLERRGARTLSPSALRKLCRLALRVERCLGGPQDVEWAQRADGSFVVLQARPITAGGTPRGTDVIWTRRFIGERWPEPASPLGWSLIGPMLEWFVAYPATQRQLLGGGPALKLVHSRPYVNATIFRHLLFKLPGAPPPRFMLELVPPEEERAWRQRHAVLPDLRLYRTVLAETVRERRWERFEANPLTNHHAWDRFRFALERDLPALAARPTDVQDALARVETQCDRIRTYIGIHVASLLFANIFYQLLESALSAWVPEHRTTLMAGLAVCPPGNLTVETNAALWSLAQQASDDDLARLAAGDPVSDGLAPHLAAFLEHYGHRAANSWEVMAPRWSRNPERLAPLLRAQRAVSDDPRAHADRQDERHDLARQQLDSAIAQGPARSTVQLLTYYTRRYLELRENQRFWFDQLLSALQESLLFLGEHLVARGQLESAAQVRWLTWPELAAAAQGGPPIEHESLRARIDQAEADARVEPPTFLVGDREVPPAPRGRRLQGLGISAGRVRGRVRVLHDLSQGDRLLAGEILVARAVDPGWTPLFLTAGGVLLELGSLLSHGAVVAREYGVPAVVNLEGICTRLRDGDEVTLDGGRGVVWLHGRGPAS